MAKFREDLFYRLRVVTIELPALRAHKEDIAALSEAFLQIHGARLGRSGRLTKEALTTLERYDWPGNIRELKNAIERAMVLSRGDEISVKRPARGSGQGHADIAEKWRRRNGSGHERK